MPFCSKCGTEINKGARFCPGCGCNVDEIHIKSQRNMEYEGRLHKCPNCGDIINPFETNCPSCGYEIRDAETSRAVKDFADRLLQARTLGEKADIIRNFPVPNTKEDIMEFMILAVSNIDENVEEDISDAWRTKIEQTYQKAELMFNAAEDKDRVENLYHQALDKLKRGKKRNNVKRVGGALSELMPVLPNTILVFGWLTGLFVLIPLCGIGLDNAGFNLSQLLVGILMIAGVFFIPHTLKCPSYLPRMILVLGLIFSFIILISKSRNALDDRGSDAYQIILLIDIVCSAIILYRMLKVSIEVEEEKQIKGAAFLVAVGALIALIIIYAISSVCAGIRDHNDKLEIKQQEEEELQEKEIEYNMTYDWPTDGLCKMIPKPLSEQGQVNFNDDERFDIDVHNYTKEQYEKYIEECNNIGYDLFTSKGESKYEAYNSERYRLYILYDEDEKVMEVSISKPNEMKEMDWPNAKIANKLPEPEFEKGYVDCDMSDSFSVIIDGLSENYYDKYVDACLKKKFDKEYNRMEGQFYGYNEDGDKVIVTKLPFNQLKISIYLEQ